MKKYLLIILLLIGCSDNVPENLISKKKMENIIFDIIILNASSTYEFKIDKNFLSDEIIFKKKQLNDEEKVGFLLSKYDEYVKNDNKELFNK